MKAFTSKLKKILSTPIIKKDSPIIILLGVILLLGRTAACFRQNKSIPQPQNQPVIEETVTVQEPVLPLTAQKPDAQEAPQAETQTPKQDAPKPAVANPIKPRTYTADELMAQLKKWEQNIKTFQAGFNQVSSYDGVEINRSQGRLYYDFTAGLMRWEMRSKDDTIDQVGITNKKDIVILDESLRPVTTLSWKEWQKGQPNQAIFDIGNYAQLAQRHHVEVTSQDDEKAVLSLTPTNTAEKYTLFITLSKKDFFPLGVALQAEDMLTTNELTNVRKNEPLPAELFGGLFK